MIRRSDVTVADSLNTPEGGVYITVKDGLGNVVALYKDDGSSLGNPFQSDAVTGAFYYNVQNAGAYIEEYRLSLSDAPRRLLSIVLGISPELMWIDIRDHGAACDAAANGSSGTDDTAAISAAIAALPADGGAIFIPAHTLCAGSIDLAGKHNVRLIGPSGSGAGFSSPPPAQLIYTGTGSRFIDARSSYAVEISGLGLRYTNPAFAGALIDFSHDASAVDAAYGLIERCFLGGYSGSASTSAILVSLNQAIICSVVDCNLQFAAVGIKGGVGTYSNSMTIERCTFGNLSTAGVMNAIQMWRVQNCTFENGPRAYFDDQAPGAVTNCLSWMNNWHGDGTLVGADTWFSYGTATTMRGLYMAGNFFDTGFTNTVCIKLSGPIEGAEIVGNTFVGASNSGIDFGSVAHVGVRLSGNFYNAEPVNIHAQTNDLWIAGNKLDGGLAKTIIRVSKPQEVQLGNYDSTGVFAALKGLSEVDMEGVAVASLPAAGTLGRRAFVTDANATTFNSIVAGSGTNKVPVYDDGTNWRIG